MATIRYGFEHDKPERLAGIEATWDPGTIALLSARGAAPGRRCLEAGAGGGSIAAWLAAQVEPDGSVVAVDIDTTHIAPIAGGVLEVREHDLTRDDFEPGSFDLVHARSVVSWLGASDAFERLVAALAPGGWLVLEDFDWAIGGPGDGDPTVTRFYEAILALLRSVGYDPHFGRSLLRRFDEAGLEETGSEARAYVIRGGSPGTAFDRFSMLAHRDTLIAAGVVTADDLDAADAYLSDPARRVLTPVCYAAWGRRPG